MTDREYKRALTEIKYRILDGDKFADLLSERGCPNSEEFIRLCGLHHDCHSCWTIWLNQCNKG